MNPDPSLPAGATLRRLQAIPDERGMFSEIFRNEWTSGSPAVQWNVTRSERGVMRGVRVHLWHDDHVVVLDGSLLIGLRDLRPNSPTRDAVSLFELRGDDLCVLTIPPGVAHGLYAPETALFVIGVTRYYDPDDEVACRWDDPDLGIPWPVSSAIVSAADAVGLRLSEVTKILDRSA